MINHFFGLGIHYNATVVDLTIKQIFSDFNKLLISLNIIQVSDLELLEVNRNFLQHDYFTDIITFNLSEVDIEAELYISYDRVLENAIKNPNEILRVVFHGVLHLCGLNDSTEIEKQTIREKEDYYINLSSTWNT